MKKPIIAVCLIALILASCGNGSKTPSKPIEAELSPKDLGYALGVSIGENISRFDFAFDYDSFLTGMKDVIEKKSPKITAEEANQKIQATITSINKKKSDMNLEKEKVFLEQNKSKKGVITTASGLQYEVEREGSGPKPTQNSMLKVNYKGSLLDGTEFDSSYKRGTPATFSPGGVIKGFGEGLLLMSAGAKYKFYIPSALAYGPQGQSKIPPSSMLIFEVELISFENKAAQK
jgi:FKBP-type peptidyl-prolyl cis-trans isomerase FkpA